MLTTSLKCIIIVVIFATSMFTGFYTTRAHFKQIKLKEYFNSFSAGVFLGQALQHMLPHSNDEYYKNDNKISETKFPQTYAMLLISYCFILMIHKVAFRGYSKDKASKKPSTHNAIYP